MKIGRKFPRAFLVSFLVLASVMYGFSSFFLVPTKATTRVGGDCIDEFCAEYFQNMTLEGDPAHTEEVPLILEYWGEDAPVEGWSTDAFSARWTGNFNFTAGNYEFKTESDDGVRLYVDSQLLIDGWTDEFTVRTAQVELSEGYHEIKLEYYENVSFALVNLVWYDAPVPCFNVFCTEYFNHKNLGGTPVFAVETPILNFDFRWGINKPIQGGPVRKDNFSVRWTGNFEFTAGKYRFKTLTDDGVRLYIDGVLLFKDWRGNGKKSLQKSKVLTEGVHEVKMEYWDRIGNAQAKLNVTKVD